MDEQKILDNLVNDFIETHSYNLPEEVVTKVLQQYCDDAKIVENDNMFHIEFYKFHMDLRRSILEFANENEDDYFGDVQTIGELKEILEANAIDSFALKEFGKRIMFFKPEGDVLYGRDDHKDEQWKWATACGGTNLITTKIMWNGSLTSIRDLSYDDLIKIAETDQYDNIVLETYGWGCTPCDGEDYYVYDSGDLPFDGYVKDRNSGSVTYFHYELGDLKDAASIFTRKELQQVVKLTDDFEAFCSQDRAEEASIEEESISDASIEDESCETASVEDEEKEIE